MRITYNLKKLTLFLQDKHRSKNIISTPDSGEYENNYISDWRDTASKKQWYSCIYMNITLACTVTVQNVLFWTNHGQIHDANATKWLISNAIWTHKQ